MSEFGFTRFGQDIIIGDTNESLKNNINILLSEITNIFENREKYNNDYQKEISNIIGAYMSDDSATNIMITELNKQIRATIIKAMNSNKSDILEVIKNGLKRIKIKIIINFIIPLMTNLYPKLDNEDIKELSSVFHYHYPNYIFEIIKLNDSYYLDK